MEVALELEVVRACAAGAADPTIGINAMIDGLVLDVIGDARPAHVAIYNYVDDAFVARKTINVEEAQNGRITLPALAIYLERPPVLDPEVQTIYRDGDFPVAFSYLTTTFDDVIRMHETLYFNRAILRFLTQFNSNAQAAKRFRNNVNLFLATALTQYTPFDQWGIAILAATTLITYRVREHLP